MNHRARDEQTPPRSGRERARISRLGVKIGDGLGNRCRALFLLSDWLRRSRFRSVSQGRGRSTGGRIPGRLHEFSGLSL
jgi:hypothetical protein